MVYKYCDEKTSDFDKNPCRFFKKIVLMEMLQIYWLCVFRWQTILLKTHYNYNGGGKVKAMSNIDALVSSLFILAGLGYESLHYNVVGEDKAMNSYKYNVLGKVKASRHYNFNGLHNKKQNTL